MGAGGIRHSYAASAGAESLLPEAGGWIRHSYSASPGAESLLPNEGGPGKGGKGIGALHNSCVAVRPSDAIEGKSGALATGDGGGVFDVEDKTPSEGLHNPGDVIWMGTAGDSGGVGAAVSAKPNHNTEVTVSNRFNGVTCFCKHEQGLPMICVM